MAAHNEFGIEGENKAADYLVREGYTILDRNWKDPAADIVKKELDHTILLLDERTAAIRKAFPEPDKKQQEETQHG